MFKQGAHSIRAWSLVASFVTVCVLATGSEAAFARDTSALTAANLQTLAETAHEKFKGVKEGKNANYIPILDTVPSELFGVAIALPDGTVFTAGDVDYRFAIESTSKPFTAALVMQQYGGPDVIFEKIGVEPTGLPFNSKLAVEILDVRSVNPLVNAGAEKPLLLMDEVFKSEYDTAWSNRGIANNLYNNERLYADAEEVLRVYTKQCSVGVTTKDLAMMGAALANDGVNSKTGKRMLDEQHVPELKGSA